MPELTIDNIYITFTLSSANSLGNLAFDPEVIRGRISCMFLITLIAVVKVSKIAKCMSLAPK